MFLNCEGRKALVTGGGSGIGRETVLCLGRLGAAVCVSDLNADSAEETVELMRSEGIDGFSVQTDVADRQDVHRTINMHLDRYGQLDILINSAGIYLDRSFVEMTDAEWQQTIKVNLDGTYNCCKEAIGSMMRQKYGRIVSLTSQAAISGSINHAHYAASKAGIIGLTCSLARELAPYNIYVNCVAPGIIKTNMTAFYTPERRQQFINLIPLGRFGDVEEAARVVAFMATDNASYMTGQTINVTGGWLMHS